ncbi:hypothetical protein DRQ33_05835 [bacterium]|nr:MAG: hypothetical protein DRQ33_05835 [bacterium]
MFKFSEYILYRNKNSRINYYTANFYCSFRNTLFVSGQFIIYIFLDFTAQIDIMIHSKTVYYTKLAQNKNSARNVLHYRGRWMII